MTWRGGESEHKMTTSMKLFVLLWLVMASRVFGAIIGGREALRIRHRTKYRQIYEWFTALGIGMILWGVADLGLIWNSIVNGPPNRSTYPSKTLWFSISFQLIETMAVWIVTLVILNGGTPGYIRRSIFWVLTKIGVMDFAEPELDPRRHLPTITTEE
jgi:hypothetical protein